MFEELILQIKHQYGKLLYFEDASNDRRAPIVGKRRQCQGFKEEETVVRFVPTGDGYQIQHQYGKVLNFDNANSKYKQSISGMRADFSVDETIVYITPKDDGYQIRHKDGKYLNFDHAYTQYTDRVYGMNTGYFEDETIVYLIPIKYNLSIKIDNYDYDTTKVMAAQLNGQIERFSLINKTFNNNSFTEQKFSINESVAVNTSTTFNHSSTDIRRWLKEVSAGVRIMTEGKVSVPLLTEGRAEAETSVGYRYTWEKESTEEFSNGTTTSVEQTINVTDEITVSPRSKMVYKYIKNQLTGITVPYTAEMKMKCKVDGNYVSKEALDFVLDDMDEHPEGEMTTENGHGVFSTRITGEIKLDVALNFSTYCDELPLENMINS